MCEVIEMGYGCTIVSLGIRGTYGRVPLVIFGERGMLLGEEIWIGV